MKKPKKNYWEERSRMSNIPKLRFPEFIGEWKEKRIDSIFDEQKEKNHPTEEVLTIIQGIGTVPRKESGRNIIFDEKSLSNYKFVQKDDFIIHLRSFEGGLEIANSNGIVSPAYIIMRPKLSIASKFFYSYFRSYNFINHVLPVAVEGVRDGRQIKYPILKKEKIPFTSFAEQQKIADFLSNVNSIITAETKILNALQKKKKALMQKLFTRQLRFKSDDGTDFPAWEETLIKNIALQVTVGIANSATHAYRADGVIMFRNQNIKENYLDDTDIIYISNDFEETYKNKRLKKYDILVTRTGYPGIACVVPEKYENAQTFTTLILRLKLEKCNPFYICQFINSPLGKKYIKLTQIGGGQKNSGAGILEKMPIKLPCIEEQQKIADCLSSIDSLIQNQQKVVTTWQQRKKALLQQMFI